MVLNLNYYPLFALKVLKLHTGIPITLSTIYSAIAKRFGIHLEPVSFRLYFSMFFIPKYRHQYDFVENVKLLLRIIFYGRFEFKEIKLEFVNIERGKVNCVSILYLMNAKYNERKGILDDFLLNQPCEMLE